MIDADWDLYRSFLAVLRAGSLSSAARQTASMEQPRQALRGGPMGAIEA